MGGDYIPRKTAEEERAERMKTTKAMKAMALTLLGMGVLARAQMRQGPGFKVLEEGSLNGVDQPADFNTNSIEEDGFWRYILDVVEPVDDSVADEIWTASMNDFGGIYDPMHIMMTSMVLHGQDEDNCPRSGKVQVGSKVERDDWAEYKQAARNGTGCLDEWKNLLRVILLMHDRVHAAMLQSAIYDNAAKGRGQQVIGDFAEEEEAPFEFEETIPDQLQAGFISLEDFQRLVWTTEFAEEEGRFLYFSFKIAFALGQKVAGLLTQWANYARYNFDEAACRPAGDDFSVITSAREWREFSVGIMNCSDTEWRKLVQTADLMDVRLHHMLKAFADYVAAEYGVKL